MSEPLMNIPTMETLDLKQAIHHIADELPDNASVHDALERLYLLAKVEQSLEQVQRGEIISHQQMREKVAVWLK